MIISLILCSLSHADRSPVRIGVSVPVDNSQASQLFLEVLSPKRNGPLEIQSASIKHHDYNSEKKMRYREQRIREKGAAKEHRVT